MTQEEFEKEARDLVEALASTGIIEDARCGDLVGILVLCTQRICTVLEKNNETT